MPQQLALPLLLLAVAVSSVGCELNVWFERRMLETVFSRMLMLSLKNPLKPRCKPRGDPEQLQHILPVTIARYPIVADSHLLSGLYFDTLSRTGVTLAFDVNTFTVHWSAASRDGAPPDRVQYKFLGLKSYNTTVLQHPSLNIPMQGFVPVADSTGFQMSLRCSSQVSGITTFEVHVVFQWPGQPERALMVMQHQFKKACLSSDGLTELQQKCHCRRKCEEKIRSRFKRPRALAEAPRRADSALEGEGPPPAPQSRRRGGRANQRRRQQRQRKKAREQRRERRKRRRLCQQRCHRGCRAKPWSCPAGQPTRPPG